MDQLSHPLLLKYSEPTKNNKNYKIEEEEEELKLRVWTETKKLWHIVGPSIFSRVASYSMNIVTLAVAGHLGDVELASISIASTVIVGFNFGLLVRTICMLDLLHLLYISLPFGRSTLN